MTFVHLHCHSPYSFLDGGSSIGDLVRRAASHGMDALALTDHDNVSGTVEFVQTSAKYGIKAIQGVEITLEDGTHLTLLSRNPAGYARMCRLISRGHGRGVRGHPRLDPDALEGAGHDLFTLSGCRRGAIPSYILRGNLEEAERIARWYREALGDAFFLELQPPSLPGDIALHRSMVALGKRLGVPLVATADVHYARKADFPVHDLLTCIRTGTTLSDTSPERHLNAENYLKSPRTMAYHFRHVPEALENARRIADACKPALDLGVQRHPTFDPPGRRDAIQQLRYLVYRGARRRYGSVGRKVRERLERELDVIISMGYADYFLLVDDVVGFARTQGIRYSGRGSAADSAVAYCLGITEVDALDRGLLFERFMSPERGEKPDIDVDFDARYRDHVARYVREQYGGDRVAAVATFNTFRARSAVRELGKAMAFSADDISALVERLPRGSGAGDVRKMIATLPELRDRARGWMGYERFFAIVGQIGGFPRHIATHCGGLVICNGPLQDVTPLQRSAKGEWICQFDKEGVEDLGLVKLDLLSLRMLSAVDDAVSTIREGDAGFEDHAIPEDDAETFSMLRRGESIGVFQLESPAQRALQSRLGAERMEDIIASVALIRPGPIQGNMVEPYIARRHGRENIAYPHPDLEPILAKTYGVILFQEQVIEIAVAIAGFRPGEADRLRRVMSRSHADEEMEALGRLFVDRAEQRGVAREKAEAIYSSVRGYASYGFCEAHAASFGMTAYKTAYLAQHYPAHFFAALLSNYPMGYYPLNTLCIEARRRGAKILPVDVNTSESRFHVEEGKNIRVSLARVRGMRAALIERILREREESPFVSAHDFRRRVRPPKDLMENLVLCGAFDSLESNRRALLWSLAGGSESRGGHAGVRDFSRGERIDWERRILGIEIGGNRMALLRSTLLERDVLSTREVRSIPDGKTVTVAGTILSPHRPPTKRGRTIVFFCLEDETGLVDGVVFPDVYGQYGHFFFPPSPYPVLVRGEVRCRSGTSIVVRHLKNLGV